MKMDQIITKVVVGFPKITLAFFIMLAMGTAWFIPGLERDPTPYLLPQAHESRVNLDKLRQNYTGANDSIIVLLEAKKTVFNFDTLTRVQKLTTAFENIHLISEKDRKSLLGLSETASPQITEKIRQLAKSPIDSETWMQIDEIKEIMELSSLENPQLLEALDNWIEKLSPIIEVTSLSNTDNILGKEGTLDINPIFDEIPQTKQGLMQLEKEVKSNALFENVLFSDKGKSTSIILELSSMDDETSTQYLIYNKVKNIVEKKITGDETHYIAGTPVVTGALGKVMEKDTQKLFPIVILIVITCLLLTFRRVKGILVPLVVVILSLVVTLGIKALFDIPLNIITTTLPVFILSIGVADGIHMFSEYRDNLLSGNKKIAAIKKTLEHLSMPVIMTSVTTAAAFYAISMTEIVQLKHFGIFVAIGTLVAMFFSLLFIPALLVILPEKNANNFAENMVFWKYLKSPDWWMKRSVNWWI
jgi:predicted RND superfamily exporter protein